MGRGEGRRRGEFGVEGERGGGDGQGGRSEGEKVVERGDCGAEQGFSSEGGSNSSSEDGGDH